MWLAFEVFMFVVVVGFAMFFFFRNTEKKIDFLEFKKENPKKKIWKFVFVVLLIFWWWGDHNKNSSWSISLEHFTREFLVFYFNPKFEKNMPLEPYIYIYIPGI